MIGSPQYDRFTYTQTLMPRKCRILTINAYSVMSNLRYSAESNENKYCLTI